MFNAERDPFLLQESSLRANKQAASRITPSLSPNYINQSAGDAENGFWLGRGCPFFVRHF